MHCVYFPPEIGGLESHVYHLCRALVEQGHRATMVTSLSMPGLPAHETMEGVDVHRTWLPSRNTPGWAAHAALSTPTLSRLAREADVVHAQDIASIPPAMWVRSRRSIPMVTTYHTSHFLMRAESPFWRPIFRRFIEAAHYNLAASTEIAGVAESVAPGRSVEALTNGVDTDRFRPVAASLPAPEGGRRRIVVPRRLFEKNGVEYFIRAVPLAPGSKGWCVNSASRIAYDSSASAPTRRCRACSPRANSPSSRRSWRPPRWRRWNVWPAAFRWPPRTSADSRKSWTTG
jgi:glycosyltransferase involved in cell wall biosynthesis